MIFLLFLTLIGWIIWSIYSLFAYRRNSFTGKTILITGGCSNIGKILVFRFLQLGAKVIVWDYSKEKLEQLSREAAYVKPQRRGSEVNGWNQTNIENNNNNSDNEKKQSETNSLEASQTTNSAPTNNINLTITPVDLSSRIQLQRMAKTLDVIDIVINAAELKGTRPFLDRPDESTERILITNVMCQLVLARACLPNMLRQKSGHFVTITNASGILGVSEHPDYSASQWASIGAHESIQMMIREHDESNKIRSTLICPFNIQNSSTNKTPLSLSSSSSSSSLSGVSTISDDDKNKNTSAPKIFNLFSFLSRSITTEEAAEKCIWAISHGIERMYIPTSLLFIPLLRVLPVPWFMWIISPRASKTKIS